MRLSKQVQIGDTTILINELKVEDLTRLWNELNVVGEMSMASPVTPELQRIWDASIIGLKLEDLKNFYPSELQQVYDAFAEVNASFFALALQVEGDNPLIRALRKAFMNSLWLRYAALLDAATPESGSTDTVSS